MGFFKDFKDDMKQAVNELIPGNEEMASEYDDEDMVNTLEETPDDNAYINTMDESPEQADASPERTSRTAETASENDFDDIDIEDIDIDEDELEEESARYEADMASLAALLSGNTTVEAVEQKEVPAEEQTDEVTEKNPEPDRMTEQTEDIETTGTADLSAGTDVPVQAEAADAPAKAEASADIEKSAEGKEPEAEPIEKEKAEMTDDKIIDITSMKEQERMAPDASADMEEKDSKTEAEVSDSTTYITQGTRIEGNIFTDGSIDLLGTVEGDVNCYGKLVVSGSITGKVNAGEIYANAARIEGEIISAGSVKIGVGSVIVGNIDAQSAVIAGAINGEVDVKGPVIVDSTAVIMGDIKSRSVQINNGAVIEGFCSQCYSDIDVKSFFA